MKNLGVRIQLIEKKLSKSSPDDFRIRSIAKIGTLTIFEGYFSLEDEEAKHKPSEKSNQKIA